MLYYLMLERLYHSKEGNVRTAEQINEIISRLEAEYIRSKDPSY